MSRMILRLTLVLAVAVAAVASLPALYAQGALAQLQAEYRSLYDAVSPSVLVVSHVPPSRIRAGNPLQAGASATSFNSAWVWGSDYIVTSLENAAPAMAQLGGSISDPEAVKRLNILWVVTADGETHECAVAGFDIPNLLLVLRKPRGLNAPGLTISETVPAIGERVAGFGNSFNAMLADGQVAFTVGSLSDSYRMEPVGLSGSSNDSADPYRGLCYEFTGAGNPGDYGGPLVGMDGTVKGMLFAHYHSGQRLPCAIPASQFLPALKSIVAGETPERARLGISITKAGRDDWPVEGVITGVTAGSPAEQAGLKVRDEIVMIDGFQVNGYDEIAQAFGIGADGYGLPPGTPILLTVRRGSQLLTFDLIAGVMQGGEPIRKASNAPLAAGVGELSSRQAAAVGKHLVQVIAVWNRAALTANQSPGSLLERMGRRATGMNDDPLFLDTTIGPHTGVVVGDKGEVLVSSQVLGVWNDSRKDGVHNALRQLYVVLHDGRTYRAEVTGRLQGQGVALLKIPVEGLEPIQFAEPSLKSGGLLTVVSRSNSPFRLAVRSGAVSAVDRDAGREFQFDAKVGACDLGALVLDIEGRPVGMVTALDTAMVGKASGVAMASYGQKLLADSLSDLRAGNFVKTPPQPFLGVAAAPAFADRAGLRVSNVTPGTGAAEAGLQEGDILLKADDRDLMRTTDLVEVIRSKSVGDKLKLTIERGEQELELTATLGERR